MASIIPGISAWGLVTGVAMVKSGMSVPLALFMTFTVFAGSAQLASLPLIAAGAPMWVIWATAFYLLDSTSFGSLPFSSRTSKILVIQGSWN